MIYKHNIKYLKINKPCLLLHIPTQFSLACLMYSVVLQVSCHYSDHQCQI